jgi:hypothetical protein
MTVAGAIRQLIHGEAAVISIDDLHVFGIAYDAVCEVKPRECRVTR